MSDIIEIKKTRYTPAQKKSYAKYYINNKVELLEKQREHYDKIKNTEDFKLRKKEYNRLYKERQAILNPDKPKRPSGRPRTVIIPNPDKDDTDYTTSESSNSTTSDDSLNTILKQFPIIPIEILLI